MKIYGLLFNGKRLFTYYVMLVVGMALIFGGILSYYNHQRILSSNLSDDEIINRAKDLGMVEWKEQFNYGEEDD